MYDDIHEKVIQPVFNGMDIQPDKRTLLFVNPDGPIIVGGPSIHSGLTGRKNAVDTYGEYARHSGHALSGKGPIRIDRTGAYAARYAAKNVVAAGLAKECEVMLSYSIGLAQPVSLRAQTFGTGTVSDDRITELLSAHFDFRLAALLRKFNLRRVTAEKAGGFYEKLASYGHMGRDDLDLPWEKTDMAEILKNA
jgi:S-adenosylmethionine synthetase